MFTRPASHVPLCWMLGATASCSDNHHQSVFKIWCLSLCFKEAIVKPLLKKKKKKKKSLTRTIWEKQQQKTTGPFLICCCCCRQRSTKKIKIFLSQISTYLNANNLIRTSQTAFKPGHSADTALLKIINDILHAFENSDVTVVTLLGPSALFNTIVLNNLSQRLEHLYGISGTPLNWFRSYLSNRTQTVTANNKLTANLAQFWRSARRSWDPFYSFCTPNLLLHSFANTPFLTSLSEMTPICTIPVVQIK